MATSPLSIKLPTPEELRALQAPPAVDLRVKYTRMVDADVDFLYGKVIGNRGPEYTLAESDAQAFSARGFALPVPATVQVWATVKNWNPQQAAENILAQSAAWRAAQIAIRQYRLSAKEALRVATTDEAKEQAYRSWKLAYGQLLTSLTA